MLLVYLTVTGYVENFVEKTGMDSHELDITNPFYEVGEDYIIVTPTYEGELNDEIEDFINYKDNINYLKGFAASGNLNFDNLYCINGKQLSRKFKKPLIIKFEFNGTDKDLEKFKEEISKIENTNT